ncbi:AAA family ATPase [Myxococcota bacterium]|nr:AAA family ATPase [Myxococcota bacterium]
MSESVRRLEQPISPAQFEQNSVTPTQTDPAIVYRFRQFELDPTLAELRRNGRRLEVQPKVLDLLLFLIERRDRVVPRVEVLDALWAEAVVGEHVLTVAVHEARAILGDSRSDQWALQTVPRRGYRFVAQVDEQSSVSPVASGSRFRLDSPDITPPSSGRASWGREREISIFDAALEATCAGRGGLIPVIGELGIGKTHLLEEFAVRAAARGLQVHRTWCSGNEGAPPLWPWSRVIRAIGSARDDLSLDGEMDEPEAIIAKIVPEWGGRSETARLSPQEERFRLFETVSTFLSNAANRQPILITLDDLHWSDSPSLHLLEFLAREARSLPLLMVAAYRDTEARSSRDRAATLARLRRGPMEETLVLEGLSRPAIEQLVRRTYGGDPTPELLKDIEIRTRGNPFFVQEIGRFLRSERVAGSEVPRGKDLRLPPGVRDAVEQRLVPLSEGCLDLLRTASVVGNEFRDDLIGRVARQDSNVVARHLLEAESHGLVEPATRCGGHHRFSHHLIQETLAARCVGVDREEIHEAIGVALEDLHSSYIEPALEELAHHFLAAFPACSAEKAVSYARRAGERAMSLHAWNEASSYFEAALDTLGGVAAGQLELRFELLLWRAESEAAANEFESRARSLYIESIEVARALGVPEKLGLAVLALSLGAVRASSDAEVARSDEYLVGLLEEALGVVDERWIDLRAALMCRLALELYGPRGWDRGVELAEKSLGLARGSGNVDCIVHAMGVRLLYESGPRWVGSRLANATKMLEITRASHRLDLAPLAHRWRIVSFLERGEMDAARAECDAYTRLGESGRALSSRWWSTTLHCALALFEGRLAAAEEACLQAQQLLQHQPSPNATAIFGAQFSFVRRAQGRLDEVVPILMSGIQPDLAEVAAPAFHASLASFHAELGNHEEARERFEGLAARGFGDLLPDLTQLYCLAMLAEACHKLGDVQRAGELYELLLPFQAQNVVLLFGGMCLGSASRYLGLLATTRSDWAAAEVHFEVSSDANRKSGGDLWRAQTELDWAQMLLARRQSGDAERGQSMLTGCLAVAQSRGWEGIATGVGSLLGDANAALSLTSIKPGRN